jgi:hypothetical protein
MRFWSRQSSILILECPDAGPRTLDGRLSVSNLCYYK